MWVKTNVATTGRGCVAMDKLRQALDVAADVSFVSGWTWLNFFLVTAPLAVSPRAEISQWIVRRLWVPGLLRYAGVRLVSHGRENLEPERPCLYLANHQSHVDVLVIFASVPSNLRFVAKKELFWIPFFGPYLYLAGFPLIDRSNRERAIRTLDQAAAKIRGGIPVVAFPEGTRSIDGRVHPFKKGPFMLALKAGVPIIPVTIAGTERVLPARSLRLQPGPVHIDFGRPIDPDDYGLAGRDRLMEDVRRVIAGRKGELDALLDQGEGTR